MKWLALLFSLTLSGCISKDLRALNMDDDDSTRIIAIAHRGASAYAPENTFAAFDKAQELGAIAAETEVQLSKDKKLVLFSDDSLEEKTGLKGSVQDHAWAELSQVDLAPWFAKTHSTTKAEVASNALQTDSKKAAGRATPKSSKRSRLNDFAPAPLTSLITLDDLFERYGMTFNYNIEVKGDDAIPELALKTASEYGLKDNVTFASHDPEQLSKFRKLDRHVRLCYLIDDRKTPELNAEIARAKTLGFQLVSVRPAIVSKDLVARAKSSGLEIQSWGPASDAEIRRAVEAGVEGMTISRPDRLMKIVQTPISR